MDMQDKIMKELKRLWIEYYVDYLGDFLSGAPARTFILKNDGEQLLYSEIKSPLERAFVLLFEENAKLMGSDSSHYGVLHSELFRWHYQYQLKTYFIDFVLESKYTKLAVEIDGFSFHDRNREQFDAERERQNYIVESGFDLFRFTYSNMIRDSDIMFDKIHEYINTKIYKAAYKEKHEVHD